MPQSSTRRRKLAILLALLMGLIATGIGGSMYYQQKKAKAAALAAASEEKSNESNPVSAASTGVVNTPETAGIPEEVAAPLQGGAAETPANTEQKPVLGKRKSAAKVIAKKDSKNDKIANSLLESAPTGAGPSEAAPGSLAAGAEPPVVASPQTETPPSLAETILEANPTGAGAGEAPVAQNTQAPTGTAGLPPGGGTQVLPTSPVPEPSTWLMMLGGLGLLAARMRRKA